jgi:DNA ligase-associated metallophosphoesterase
MIEIQLHGEQLRLLPQRVLYWPRRETLLLADPHFGKAAAFRTAGIPIPGGTTADNLSQLTRAIEQTQAKRIICLGDLFHAKNGRAPHTLAVMEAWRAAHSHLEIQLVRGNHDQHAGDPPAEWRIHCLDEPILEPPFAWRHTPEPTPGHYTLAGHLHPAARVGRGKLAETLPCFHFGRYVGLLPAFGAFTGTATVRSQPGDRLYVIADDIVLALRR